MQSTNHTYRPYSAARKNRRRNSRVRICSSTPKSQVMDAYAVMYRQMLRQQKMGHDAEAAQIEMAMREMDGMASIKATNPSITVREINLDGSLSLRTLDARKICDIQQHGDGTLIFSDDGTRVFAQETAGKILSMLRKKH